MLKKYRVILVCLVLAAATLVAYEPVRHNEFVSYDDKEYLTANPNVTGGITRDSVIWAFTRSYARNWHPLTWLSHMLDYELFGLNPLGHHLVSLSIHIINALLLFWILTNLTSSVWASAFVAAVFALHPLQVDSVAWAAERKTVLSGLFWLLTIAVYIWYTKKPGIGRYIMVFASFGLCIMTKPVVVTLPLVLLLLDYWPLNRLSVADCRLPIVNRKLEIGNWKFLRLFFEKVPLLALSAILIVITLIAQSGEGTIPTLDMLRLDSRIANAFVAYIRYIGKTIWPSGLAVFYPNQRINLLNVTAIICFLLFILITAISVYAGRRRKYLVVGWLWFVVTLVPMIGLVQAGAQSMANRYMYISMLGLLIIVAWSVKEFVGNRLSRRAITAVLAIAILSAAVMVTRTQVGYWRSELTLFEYALEVTKNNAIAETNYASALFREGRFREAELHYSNAVRIDPKYSSKARNNLGYIFLREGKPYESAACFTELLKQEPNFLNANFGLAVALSRQGKYDEAIRYFKKVMELDPKLPNARAKMGYVLLMAKRPDEAVACLNEALKTSTDRMEVYVNLAIAYSQLGDFKQSIQNCNKAAELKSDDPEVLNNLAWLLATDGNVSIQDTNNAVKCAERACKLTGNKNISFLDTLAAAYAAAGKFAEAKTTAEKAVKDARVAGKEELAREIEGRLKLYQEGHRYIQK
ncbi:MAG: tetratricopeptide repeat protein [Sedimentisphaerales bacterium]